MEPPASDPHKQSAPLFKITIRMDYAEPATRTVYQRHASQEDAEEHVFTKINDSATHNRMKNVEGPAAIIHSMKTGDLKAEEITEDEVEQ